MQSKKDIRFFPIFIAATLGVFIDLITTFVDEVVVGNLFDDAAFASVNLIEPYTYFTAFVAYLVSVGGCALIIRAHIGRTCGGACADVCIRAADQEGEAF